MKSRYNTRQNRPIVNVTDDTSDAIRSSSTLAQPVCTTQHNTSFGLARAAMCAFVLLMLICGTTPVVAGYSVPVDTVNGISGFLNTTIPSNSTIDTYTTAGIDTVESTLDWDAITSGTWNSYLASAQYCYDQNRRSGMRMNVGGDYASSTYRDDVKTNITSYLPDLKSDPYSDTIQYIVINLTNPSGTSRTAFVNEIGQEICEQTDNKFKVVVVESLSGLDSAYVSESPVIYKSLSTVPDWIDFETDTLRGNTTLSRVYSGSESFLSNLADYRGNILNRLRDTPNISNHYSETYSVKIGDGDIVLFNNGSSTVDRTVANAPSGYYWASINDTMVDLSAGSATIGFYIPALSFDYILKESSLDHITYISDSSSQLWGEETITDEHIEYHDGVMDTNYIWLDNNIDIRAEFWDPEYTRDNTFILHYEWINASPIKDYHTYDYIVIADKNANEITNTIARLNDTYGYVALGDYGNSEVWQTNKIAAIDDWIDNYGINIFLDEIDFAASGDNSSSRLKDLVDHIHSKDKKVFMNIYTHYKEFGTYGDVVMKESCFSRWGGDVNNPTYTWEEMWIEKERADYYTAHNITVAGLSLGGLNDYDKMAFDYAAFAVLYGLTGNNSYRYGQPNFQSQHEIMVYPLGPVLEPSYTETSPTDWNRLYQAGRVHINPVDHTWWVDDNKEPSNLTVSAYFYGGGDFGGGQHVKVFANSNESTSTIYFNNGVDPLWTWVWRSCELDKSVYEPHGHYYVYMYYRGVSGGWNFFGEATELTPGDAKTWFDTTSNNLPATTTDQTWIGLATYNFMINLTINYTSSENVDELVDRISQTPTTTKSGGVVTHTTTISSDKDLTLPVWSGTWNISAYADSNAYANDSSGDWVEVGVNDVPDASADTLDWYYTTVDGEQYGLVRESRGNDMYLYRFLLPHTSIHTFMTNSSMPVPADPITLANTTGNFWVNHTWQAGSGGNATDSYNVNMNGTWTNGTTATFLNTSVGSGGWANITVWAWNASGIGTLSAGCVSDEVQAPSAPAPALNCTCGDICVNDSGWWSDGGVLNTSVTPIQAAIDGATAGETICVGAGSYTENVNVNKQLTLRGEGADVVTVTAADSDDNVFVVTADYVNISGFNATGAAMTDDGIYLNSADHCNIYENAASNNGFGIRLHSSSNNTLVNNTAESNNWCGIYLRSSSNNNTLANNNANSNSYGIYLQSSSSNNTLLNNTANSNNYYGIALSSSSNNKLTSNAANLNDYGIYLNSSSGNTIYNNHFNNIQNTYDDGYNIWNITPTAGTNIIGGSWLGGNYWSDYTGADTNGDGLGDTLTPYDSSGNISNGGDYHPVVQAAAICTPPDPTTLTNTTGNYWVNHTWSAGSGNVTDSYNVRVNGIWHNGTTNTFRNDTHTAHAWQNIAVYAWNSSSTGTLSTGCVSQNTRIPNNPVTVTNTSDWCGDAGETVCINYDATDADSDTPTFSCNRTDLFTDFSTATGQGNWTATSGTHYVDFGVSDGWGSTSNYTMTIMVNGTAPPVIHSVLLDPTEVAPNGSIIVTVTATDESGIASVNADGVSLADAGNDTWTGTITAASTPGTYNVTVVATDASPNGNNATDNGATYTVTEPVPPVTLYIEDVAIRQGENKTVPITIFDVVNMGGCEINFTYDQAVVYVTDVARGDLNFSFTYNINNGSGWMRANALDDAGQSGDVVFAYVTLTAVGNKSDVSEMEFEYSQLLDASFGEIAHIRDNGTFSILQNVLPEVSNVSATPIAILYDNGRPRTPGTNISLLSAYVADTDGSIATVTINLSLIGGLSDQPMEHVSGDLWTLTTNATEVAAAINAPNFTHQLAITATDNDGGINDSVSIELTVLKRGDVNGDGLVDKADADYISRYLAGLEPEASNPPSVLTGDVIGDAGDPVGNGVVDLVDALYLARYTRGMVEEP